MFVYLTENTGKLLPRQSIFLHLVFFLQCRITHLFLLSVLRVIISFLSPVVKYMRTNAYVKVVKHVKDFKKNIAKNTCRYNSVSLKQFLSIFTAQN